MFIRRFKEAHFFTLCGLNCIEANLTPFLLKAKKIAQKSTLYTSSTLLIEITCWILRSLVWNQDGHIDIHVYRNLYDDVWLELQSILCSRSLMSKDIKGAL
jgi:hypothetical protein